MRAPYRLHSVTLNVAHCDATARCPGVRSGARSVGHHHHQQPHTQCAHVIYRLHCNHRSQRGCGCQPCTRLVLQFAQRPKSTIVALRSPARRRDATRRQNLESSRGHISEKLIYDHFVAVVAHLGDVSMSHLRSDMCVRRTQSISRDFGT